MKNCFLLVFVVFSSCAILVPNYSKVQIEEYEKESNISILTLKNNELVVNTNVFNNKFTYLGTNDSIAIIDNRSFLTIIKDEKPGFKTRNYIHYKTKFNPIFLLDIPYGIAFLGVPILVESLFKAHKKYDNYYQLEEKYEYPKKLYNECYLKINEFLYEEGPIDFIVYECDKIEQLLYDELLTTTKNPIYIKSQIGIKFHAQLDSLSETLNRWGFKPDVEIDRNILYLDFEIDKIEFVTFAGIFKINSLIKWRLINSISHQEIFNKEINSTSNYSKLFSHRYDFKTPNYESDLQNLIKDNLENSMIQFLNDSSFISNSKLINKAINYSNKPEVIKINEPIKIIDSLKNVGNTIAFLKTDKLFTTATIISSDGYAITALDVLLDPNIDRSVFFNDGSTCLFDIIKTNMDYNLALIKLKSLPKNAVTFSLNKEIKINLGEDIYLVSQNMLEDKINNSIVKGMVASNTFKGELEMFQIDVSFNKWNAASPIFDKDGNVLGIGISLINVEKGTTTPVLTISSLKKLFNINENED